jgi:hypothetical protein
MDEFHRVKPGAALLTYGVSTCTGIVITRPGHFGYLGHASTYDRCYGAGDIDLVAQMLKRIRQFEVYPSELRELRAVIVAPHVASARGVIERLLDAGLLLSQITFVRDPGARRADVRHDPSTGATWVRWCDDAGRLPLDRHGRRARPRQPGPGGPGLSRGRQQRRHPRADAVAAGLPDGSGLAP